MYTLRSICLISIIALAAAASPDVQIKNLRLFYGDQEYYIKGMAYSPSPLEKVSEGQNDGTGLCKARPTYGAGTHTDVSMIGGCNTEDYFDAAIYSFGPQKGWFNALWERDFPIISQMGINTIRIYHANPVTAAAIQNGPYTDKTVVGSNHIPFMDLAQQYNLKVVFPLYAESYAIDTIDPSYLQEYIRNLIDEVGNHPALLMYTFGNELQFSDPSRGQAYIDKINSYIDYAKNYQQTRWGRKIPFTVALIDLPDFYSKLVGTNGLHFDVVTTNAGYRGFTFTDLWSSHLYGVSCQTGIPSLIGEMGVHQNTPQFDVPGWFPAMWSDVIAHKTQGCIGGFYFSWVEEHWKGVVPGADWTTYPDVYMGVMSQSRPSGSDPFAADVITPKSGSAYDYDGAVTGYKQNPFAQDSAQTLESAAANYCDGSFQVPPAIQPPPPATKPFVPDATSVTSMPTPMAYYTFDQMSNGKVSDLLNGHDATVTSGAVLSTGVKGSALNLDGSQTAQLSGMSGLTGDMTVSLWLYVNVATDQEAKILSNKNQWDDANGFEITFYSKTNLIKVVGGGSSVAEFSKITVPVGTWFHVAVTVTSAGKANVYFDGIQVAPGSQSVTPITASTNAMYLGSEAGKVAFLAAAVDELVIFNSIVGGDQIMRLADSSNLPSFSAAVVTPSLTVSLAPTPTSSSSSSASEVATSASGSTPSSTTPSLSSSTVSSTTSSSGSALGSVQSSTDKVSTTTVFDSNTDGTNRTLTTVSAFSSAERTTVTFMMVAIVIFMAI